jgi:hypothetical protein
VNLYLSKTCTKCLVDLRLENFSERGGGKLNAQCKGCISEKGKIYVAANREKKRAYNAAYHSTPEFRERYNAKVRAEYAADPVLARQRQRSKQAKNPEAVKKATARMNAIYAVTLPDSLVRARLAAHSPLSPADFPEEMVAAKRIQIQIQRAIK